MMKYMVMETDIAYAVVLSEDGRFIKVANLNYEVGQTVSDIVEFKPFDGQTEKNSKKSRFRVISGLVAAAACFVFIMGYIINTANTPYASVFLKINPQVRVDIDRHDVVKHIEGINTDGKTLIEGYSYKGKLLEPVMEELVDLAIEQGFLHEGGKVSINLDGKDTGWVESEKQLLNSKLSGYLTEKITVTLEIADMSQPFSDYEPSDYGDTSYGESDYEDGAEVDTDYGENSDGVTDYDDKEDDTTDFGPDRDGVTDFDSDYKPEDDDSGFTPYSTPEPQTDYQHGDDGVTDFEPEGSSRYDESDYGSSSSPSQSSESKEESDYDEDSYPYEPDDDNDEDDDDDDDDDGDSPYDDDD